MVRTRLTRTESVPDAFRLNEIEKQTTSLKDWRHHQGLELVRLDKREADIKECAACTQEIIDDWYYKYPEVEDNYFLHKVCGELPMEINHGLHPGHTLLMVTYINQAFIRCDSCLKVFNEGYYYYCKQCNFYLSLTCATLAERQLEHPGHPHPLTLLVREIQTQCNCCGKEHRGKFYQCLKCVGFFIHKDCSSLGTQVDCPNHPHPLDFVYSGHKCDIAVQCDLCYKMIDKHGSWYLECVPCEFDSHVYCAMFEGNEEVKEIDYEIPHLPWEECEGEFGIVGLLNRKIATNHEQMKITHFSHPQHELVLHGEVPKIEDPYTGHNIPLLTKCNGCTRNITSPFYSCLDCDFFLHKCCASLPTSTPNLLFHRKHRPFNLVLSRKPWRGDEIFNCECCGEVCNGFYYECEEESCGYIVDVECAFLPTSIVHKSHPHLHLLTLTNNSLVRIPNRCCAQDMSWSAYECGDPSCQFMIHFDCAMYPAKLSHRYDHENPFKLWYDRGAVEANYFYCERCEQSIEPKGWYYHNRSSIGDQLMHPNCILQQEHQDFPKFKSTTNFLQPDIHPHRLHLSPSRSTNSFSKPCAHCDKKIQQWTLSYNCWEPDCGFRLHDSCAKELQGRYSTSGEEYPDISY